MPPPAPSALRITVKADGATIEDVFAAAAPSALSRGGGGGGGSAGASSSSAAAATPARAGAGAAHAAPERLALTPRSAEACLMEGVDPKDLFDRPPESFGAEGGRVDPAIVRMVSAPRGAGAGHARRSRVRASAGASLSTDACANGCAARLRRQAAPALATVTPRLPTSFQLLPYSF
jgi:hypothetical protein